MARLVTAGAEIGLGVTGNRGPDGYPSNSGTTRDTGTFRSGAASYKFSTAGGGNALLLWTTATAASSTTYYARAYFLCSAAPDTANRIITSFNAAASPAARLRTDGSVELLVNSAVQGSPSSSIADSSWHMVEVSATLDGTAANYTAAELRVDGSTVATWSGTVAAGTNFSPYVGFSDGTTGAFTLYADDVAFNDSSGGSQNSWPGSGKVVLLLPTSDNARGTGWVNDANAASNFFQATDNTPPDGIADTTASTGLHQIRNGTSNANSNVDLNLTDYTTAGVGASDTINVLLPLTATGAPVSTSAKLGTIGVSSNPAIANISLAAGGTSGAFWSGTAAGTYPTGWKWSSGTTTYAPSPTLGSSPVIRITQVTSSTRIAMCCFLGMYVDYTPAVAAAEIPFLVQARR